MNAIVERNVAAYPAGGIENSNFIPAMVTFRSLFWWRRCTLAIRPGARAVLVALAISANAPAWSQASRLVAPNVVEISPHLVTSGQPSAEALAGLKAQDFEAVIYLAPPTVSDAVRDEQLIVTRQGLTFINIPIYATLSGVWSPDGPWRRLIESQLQKHNIAFEIL